VYASEKKTSEATDIPVRCLQNWRVRGGGPPFYKVGRLVRYDLDEVIAWVKARRVTSTTEVDQREEIRAQRSHHGLTE
jgi:phage terminase Nu1 subunit (DNA packaging protein)